MVLRILSIEDRGDNSSGKIISSVVLVLTKPLFNVINSLYKFKIFFHFSEIAIFLPK